MPLSQENRMQMAIAAYKSKKVQLKSRAAAIFGVPKSTFLDRLKGINPWSETRASGHKLIAIKEDVLVKRLLDIDKQGFSIHPEFLRGMAQTLLCECSQDATAVLRVNWASYFVKHRPELRARYNERIIYQRAKQENLKVIKQWFKAVYKAIQEHGVHEDDIWNFDETGFAMGLCTTSKVITAIEHSERPHTVIQGNQE
jgi:hypothetical protein